MIKNASSSSDKFRHQALFYEGVDGFIDHLAPFLRDGLERREPSLVVVSAEKIARLRSALGSEAERIEFADMADVGRNPARIIPAWQQFVDRHRGSGQQLRGVGEPIYPERSADELVECQRHEELLNVAFADDIPWWLLCPYDTTALPSAVIEAARQSHPHLQHGHDHSESPAWIGLESASRRWSRPLAVPSGEVFEIAFAAEDLGRLRALVARGAARAGLTPQVVEMAILAANEVASNSANHGGGAGIARVWNDRERFLVEISDVHGTFSDPLLGRRLPTAGDVDAARGLWVANQACDLVELRTADAGGTTVRLTFRLT